MTVVFGAGLFACADTTRKAEENLERIRMKALSIDSIIAEEQQKLHALDSILMQEFEKAGNLDSLVSRESARIDSLMKKYIRNRKAINKQAE
jgi:hypothetical protein